MLTGATNRISASGWPLANWGWIYAACAKSGRLPDWST